MEGCSLPTALGESCGVKSAVQSVRESCAERGEARTIRFVAETGEWLRNRHSTSSPKL
jgi:hypothetical protein